jgi:4,5-DOPA dioxygenase extradiol
MLSDIHAEEDSSRGLDHGAWSVLIQMYPEKDIPVFQVSLDMRRDNTFFLELGKKLSVLREQGVLILCSGNVVHNLRQVQWSGGVLPEASAFQSAVVKALQERDIGSLLHYEKYGDVAMFAVPTREHYLPFLVALGASRDTDTLAIHNDAIDLGSISMLCALWG